MTGVTVGFARDRRWRMTSWKKRIGAVVLAFSLTAVIAACGDDDDADTKGSEAGAGEFEPKVKGEAKQPPYPVVKQQPKPAQQAELVAQSGFEKVETGEPKLPNRFEKNGQGRGGKPLPK